MNKGEVLIHIVKSQTVNLGNYNSARVECGMDKIVDEKDKEIEIQRLSIELDDLIEQELKGLE